MAKTRSLLRVCAADGCHEVFETWGNQKFHSNACRQRQYRLEKNAMLKPALQEKRRCRNCGEVYYCPPWSKKEYHSNACKQAFYRERKNWAEDHK